MSENTSQFVPRDEFDAAVKATVKLIEQGVLWWRISSAGIEPRLDAQKVEGAVPKDYQPKYLALLNSEIVPALDSALFNEPPAAMLNFRFREVSDQTLAEFHARVEAVKGPLVTKGLSQRALIRRTCKGPALDDIKWDISVKKHDLAEGGIADVAYATLEVVYSIGIPPGQSRYRFLFGGESRDSIVFDCHADDLDALIRDLEQVRDNLKRLSSPQT